MGSSGQTVMVTVLPSKNPNAVISLAGDHTKGREVVLMKETGAVRPPRRPAGARSP